MTAWKFQNLCHQGIVVRQYEGKQHCYQGNIRSPSENKCHSKKVVAKLVVKVQITMKVCWTKNKNKNKIKIQERKGERRMAEGTRWLQTFCFYSHGQRLKKNNNKSCQIWKVHRPPFSCVQPFCLKLLFVWCATHSQVNKGDKTRHQNKKKRGGKKRKDGRIVFSLHVVLQFKLGSISGPTHFCYSLDTTLL